MFCEVPILKVAVLVDGEFFLKRYRRICPDSSKDLAQQVAKAMHKLMLDHVNRPNDRESNQERCALYRIFFYDCAPYTGKLHNPISKKCIDYSKTDQAIWRLEFHEQLKKLRKVALRLGTLGTGRDWSIHKKRIDQMFKGSIAFGDLTDKDVFPVLKQKGVDIKIGLDIASLAFKKQVERIVLVSGDTDFVPAAKLARREGIDFVLDPMWNPINPLLWEHIDGLHSTCPNPKKAVS